MATSSGWPSTRWSCCKAYSSKIRDKKNQETVVPATHVWQLVQWWPVVAALAGTILSRVNFVDLSKSFVYLFNFSWLFFSVEKKSGCTLQNAHCAVVPWFPLAGECYELECFKTQKYCPSYWEQSESWCHVQERSSSVSCLGVEDNPPDCFIVSHLLL